MIRHAFPGVNVDELEDEEFCRLAKDAEWLMKRIHGEPKKETTPNRNVVRRTE